MLLGEPYGMLGQTQARQVPFVLDSFSGPLIAMSFAQKIQVQVLAFPKHLTGLAPDQLPFTHPHSL